MSKYKLQNNETKLRVDRQGESSNDSSLAGLCLSARLFKNG